MNDDMCDHLAEVERETKMLRARIERKDRMMKRALDHLEAYNNHHCRAVKDLLRSAMEAGS